MDKAFQAVVKTYKSVSPNLTHKQQVQRLYRHSLRNIISWCESRDVFNEEALKIRAQFDSNKNADVAKTARLMREAREALAQQTHPDPYIQAYMPGGSLFMRNPAPPLESLFPDGIPEGMSRRRLNIDMSNISDEQEYADPVFVDSANKSYYLAK